MHSNNSVALHNCVCRYYVTMNQEDIKLLTQGCDFLQRYLKVDDSLIKNLSRCDVITAEQAKLIMVGRGV